MSSEKARVFVIEDNVAWDWDVRELLEKAEQIGIGQRVDQESDETERGAMEGWEIWVFGS